MGKIRLYGANGEHIDLTTVSQGERYEYTSSIYFVRPIFDFGTSLGTLTFDSNGRWYFIDNSSYLSLKVEPGYRDKLTATVYLYHHNRITGTYAFPLEDQQLSLSDLFVTLIMGDNSFTKPFKPIPSLDIMYSLNVTGFSGGQGNIYTAAYYTSAPFQNTNESFLLQQASSPESTTTTKTFGNTPKNYLINTAAGITFNNVQEWNEFFSANGEELPDTYTATFSGGAGSTGTPPEPVSGQSDPETGKATITIPSGSGTLAKQGLFFDGWEFNGPIGTIVLHAGEVIQISSDVTLTAHWISINPEYPGEPSEPGGGGGSLVIESDDIDIPDLPGSSVGLDAGVLAMFNPDIADLSNLEGYLMQTSVASALRNIFQDPMNCVVSLKAVPFTPNTTADKKEWIVAAGLGLGSTGVYMKAITNQYVEFDFGDITVDEVWGNALDYAPNTEIQIYMPYIGVRSIDTDDIMGGTIKLTYHVDLLSGIISAFLTVTRDGHSNVIYTWTGSCGIQLPLTGADSASIIRNAISLAGMVTTGVASGGASTVAGAAQLGANAVGQATGGMKVPVQRGGQISGDAGNLGSQTPYLIFNRPHQSIPEGFGRQFGYTCNISGPLSQFRGMTVVRATHMEGFPATDEEVKEIEALLKKGVIL